MQLSHKCLFSLKVMHEVDTLRFLHVQLIRDNLQLFSAALQSNKPLFQVDTLLAVPDVILHPTSNEVFKMVLQCIRDCVEG